MSHHFLDTILEEKKREVDALHTQGFSQADPGIPRYSFFQAIGRPSLSLIAEVKQASPSKGIIRSLFDPVSLATQFEASGAMALSVLTETTSFLGHLDFIARIKQAGVRLPILRKDFIIDSLQLEASVRAGADAVLLIASLVSQERLFSLHAYALSIGLEVLVEVHHELELSVVQTIPGIRMIGINNRDLRTFTVDEALATRLKKQVSPLFKGLIVAESGYQQLSQLSSLQAEGFDAVLIGEGLIKNPDLTTFFSSKGPL